MILFAAESGVYAGMLFSFALDMMVGLLHLTALEKEEKTAWGKYQRTLPVGAGKVVAGKYAVVLLTVLVSITGAVVSNLAAFAFYRTFLPEALRWSVLVAAVTPPVWAAFNLPFYYWLGSQVAQFTCFPLAFFFFYAIKNFEAGMWALSDLTFLAENVRSLLPLALLALAGVFLASLAISAAGCRCKR